VIVGGRGQVALELGLTMKYGLTWQRSRRTDLVDGLGERLECEQRGLSVVDTRG
jgi:hypothetical protein